jgi:hypothetical protein
MYVSSHGNKTSRSRSVVKQKGMVFGFRKTATAVVGPEIDRSSQLTSRIIVKNELERKCKEAVIVQFYSRLWSFVWMEREKPLRIGWE